MAQTDEDFLTTAAGRVEEAYQTLGQVLDELSHIGAAKVDQKLHSESESAIDAELGLLAKQLLDERRLRDRVIRQAFFGEPVWDLLLNLFVASALNQPLTVTAACASAGCPQTTALRYIDQLEIKGLIEKTKSGDDKRMIFVQLTSRSLTLLTEYLTRVVHLRNSRK